MNAFARLEFVKKTKKTKIRNFYELSQQNKLSPFIIITEINFE